MPKFTIELPAHTMIRNVNGKPINLEWDKMPESVIVPLLIGGAKVVLTNAFNSGGKDKSESERLAQLEKRLGAFYRGEYVIAERGESAYTGMWNAYVDDVRAKTGCSVKDVEDSRRETIRTAFGENEKVSTARFFEALATMLAKENKTDMATELEAIETHYAGLAAEAEKRRAEVVNKIDVKGLALAAFKKPTK